MKVLFVTPSMSTKFGGTTSAINNISDCLSGFDVEIFLASGFCDKDGPQRVSKSFRNTFFFSSFRFYNLSVTYIFWCFRNINNFDVIHIHGTYNFFMLISYIFCMIYRKPYIISPHGMLGIFSFENKKVKKNISFYLLERMVLIFARSIHVATVKEKMELQSRMPKSLLSHVPLPVISPKRCSLVKKYVEDKKCSNRFKKVIFVGRLDKIKNIECLFHALARDENASCYLRIAGDGPDNYKQALVKLTHELDIHQRVEWLGHVQNMTSIYESADVFVLPSLSESFGLVAVEAALCGLPLVLSSGVGIAPDLCRWGNGVIVDPTVGGLSAGINEVCRNPQYAVKAKRVLSVVERNFSPSEVGRFYADLYHNRGK